MMNLPAEPSWRFVAYEDGVLSMRHCDCELRVRFWPDPFLTVNQSVQEDLGDRLLSRSGYFEEIPTEERVLGLTSSANDFLRLRSCPSERALPVVGIECVQVDGAPRLIHANGQLVFDFDLLSLDCDPVWLVDRALDLAVAHIPIEIRKRLPYFECSCWGLLQLVWACREVAGLMCSNAILLLLWFRKVDYDLAKVDEQMRGMMRRTQRVQFEEFGFDGAQRWVNILRKVPVEEINLLQERLGEILLSVRDSKLITYLQHRPVVTAFELELVMTTPLIQQMKAHPEWGEGRVNMANLILFRLHGLPKDSGLKLSPRLIALIRDLQKMSAERANRVDSKEWIRVALPFPCPEGWDYLDTRDQVNAEGVAQKNCLQNQRSRFNEDYFFFSIKHPVRASLCVCKNAFGKFEVADCRAKCNTDVSLVDLLSIRKTLRDTLAKPINLSF
jgi:hypothetical protein